jgi:HTH-type transcriptional regulator/antitoxin HigA
MEALKYKIIKTEAQYDKYCRNLEELLDSNSRNKSVNEEIELITLLIEKWDDEHNTFDDLDPVELLKSLMKDHDLKAVSLAEILDVSKSLISDILNYKKGFSKEVIRKLAHYFKVDQEAFNRYYNIVSPVNAHLKNVRVMNTLKEIPLTRLPVKAATRHFEMVASTKNTPASKTRMRTK